MQLLKNSKAPSGDSSADFLTLFQSTASILTSDELCLYLSHMYLHVRLFYLFIGQEMVEMCLCVHACMSEQAAQINYH